MFDVATASTGFQLNAEIGVILRIADRGGERNHAVYVSVCFINVRYAFLCAFAAESQTGAAAQLLSVPY